MTDKLSDLDENSHYPQAGADPSWQESWAFAWYDPDQRLGCAQHISIQRITGNADATSFITRDGAFIQRYQKYDLKAPEGDYTDLVAGPLHVRTLEPFKRHAIRLSDEGCEAEFEVVSNLAPTSFGYADIAKGHWELYGRTRGLIRLADGQEIKVDAHCFLDRSWGPRDNTILAANRYFFAMFGDDLVFKLIRLRMSDGSIIHNGIVVRNGEQLTVVRVRSETVMDDDGLYPLSSKVTATLEDGTSHYLEVFCDGGDLALSQTPNFKSAWVNATYRYGGRVGTGFVAVQELDRLPPWDHQLLAMAETRPRP